MSEPPRSFRLGAVAGSTPGRWIDTWHERMPHVPLELVPLEIDGQRAALTEGLVDAALIRLPAAGTAQADDWHVIRLYEEVSVVIVPAESSLLAADELDTADLAGEVRIVPADDAFAGVPIPGTVPPDFPEALSTADAVATVAAGVGIVVVPLSLARLHDRKDVDHRPLRAFPTSPVALAWPRERTSADVETFVGIVRGRTARSSR